MHKALRPIFFFLVVVLPLHVISQCPPESLVLSSQVQINTLSKDYPDCALIPGNVMIGMPHGRTDIHDLSPLKHIQSIGGHLNILNNPHLASLKGLENLETIGGYLNIFNNDQLDNIDELHNLTSVDGSLWILCNERLNSVEGLQNVTAIDGSLDVSFNPSLSSLKGLEHINPGTIRPMLGFLLAKVNDVRMIENMVDSEEYSVRSFLAKFDIDPVENFQSFAGIPYHSRLVRTDMLYMDVEIMQDSIQARSLLEEIDAMARSSGDAGLQWEARLVREYYNLKHGLGPIADRTEKFSAFAASAGRSEHHLIQARALKLLTFTFWEHYPDYEKLFKTYHELEETISRFSPSQFPDMAQCYMVIGRAHYYFRDYRKAMHYFRKASALPQIPFNTTFIMHSTNNMGLCYQKLNLLDSSDLYFQRILEDTTQYPVEVWKSIASSNLAMNHYLRKEYDKAIPMFQRDYLSAESFNDLGLAVGSLVPLADMLLSQGHLEEAEIYIKKARDYIRLSGQTDRLQSLFPVISKWYAAHGDAELASAYVDSTQQAIQAYNDKFNALKLLRAKQELNANERALQEVQKQNLIQQRNTIIGVLVLTTILGLVFQWNRNHNLKRKREIRELKLKHTQESLDHAQSRLQNLTRKIRENNQLIDHLQQIHSEEPDAEALMELQNTTILTKDDWLEFKKLFQMVHPGFIAILESRHPNLTPAEIRCLCLQKLGLSSYEIASAQGVSSKTINVTKYRIRKKLNLENQEMLDELVNNIG